MDRLPKDVQLIVYRYLFTYTYRDVMIQYRDIWLNHMRAPSTHNRRKMYWSEVAQGFFRCGSYSSVANWRRQRYRPSYGNVLHFFDYSKRTHPLPKHY